MARHIAPTDQCSADPCPGHVWRFAAHAVDVRDPSVGVVDFWRAWDFDAKGTLYRPVVVAVRTLDDRVWSVATVGTQPWLCDLWWDVFGLDAPSARARHLENMPGWLHQWVHNHLPTD